MNREPDLDDLESDALLGFVQAANRFTPEKQVTFKTFATARIEGSMIDGLRRRGGTRRESPNPRVLSLDLRVGAFRGETLGEHNCRGRSARCSNRI